MKLVRVTKKADVAFNEDVFRRWVDERRKKYQRLFSQFEIRLDVSKNKLTIYIFMRNARYDARSTEELMRSLNAAFYTIGGIASLCRKLFPSVEVVW